MISNRIKKLILCICVVLILGTVVCVIEHSTKCGKGIELFMYFAVPLSLVYIDIRRSKKKCEGTTEKPRTWNYYMNGYCLLAVVLFVIFLVFDAAYSFIYRTPMMLKERMSIKGFFEGALLFMPLFFFGIWAWAQNADYKEEWAKKHPEEALKIEEEKSTRRRDGYWGSSSLASCSMYHFIDYHSFLDCYCITYTYPASVILKSFKEINEGFS